MDYWGPKHVEPPSVMNKLNHKTMCILLDYINKLYDVFEIKNIIEILGTRVSVDFMYVYKVSKFCVL